MMMTAICSDLHPDNSNTQLLKIFIDTDSFSCSLKDAILSHIHSSIPNIEMINLGIDKYYAIASFVGFHISTSRSSSPITTCGLLFYGIDVGVSIFANKQPYIYIAFCTLLDNIVKVLDA